MPEGHLIGNKEGIKYFGKYRWWAERGLIHWEHVDTGDYGTMQVRVCLERLERLNVMVKNVRHSDKDPSKGEGALEAAFGGDSRAQSRYIEDMIELCQRARAQGTPTDDSAIRDLKRRRPTTVIVPGLGTQF